MLVTPAGSTATSAAAEAQPCEDDCNINVLFNFNSGMRVGLLLPRWSLALHAFPDDDDDAEF